MKVTVITAPNIALIKYWGKENEELFIPINSSLSVTLDSKDMSTTTTLSFNETNEDILILNGKQCPLAKRMTNILSWFRGETKETRPILINTQNSFPTAAGLASSSSSYSAFVIALFLLLNPTHPPTLSIEELSFLSTISRQGSGSSCRSMFGGCVEWEKGSSSDSRSSKAVQICTSAALSDLEILVCVVSSAAKSIGSTEGMQKTANDPSLRTLRETNVPPRLEKAKLSILSKDFASLAQITMDECTEFLHCCSTTIPPNGYLSPISTQIIQAVNDFNTINKNLLVFYTFDAGPNAILFTRTGDLLSFLDYFLRKPITNSSTKRTSVQTKDPICSKFIEEWHTGPGETDQEIIQTIIHTKVGEGPHIEIS
ncbi:putative Diphosphomevalonate decarboxylase [Blattamonas nauphoetae]|uniref:Diphosphomevalonate decarboxylase n=1 Tax=Blattamonas nauphoetae TaxID=2049346 RepID=A0ABQ9Y0Z9_9EUKA|nr:putative Diphosphomevalonate decarboxylase [Blattamonas nauphoetae]